MFWVCKKDVFTIKTVWVLANLAFTALLTVQLTQVLGGYIKPQITQTWEEEVPLGAMEFPLVIKICVVPGFNQTALREVGYEDTYAYFLGLDNIDNGNVFGWAGHTGDSGTFGTVEEVLAKVSDIKIEQIVELLTVWVEHDERIDIPRDYINSSRVNYPNNCHSLTLSDIPELDGKNIQEVFLYIGDLRGHELQILFTGKSLDCRRNIIDHSFYSMGNDITLTQNNMTMSYMVGIAQREYVEDDPSSRCRNYPNNEYASYEECDNQFVRNKLPGLTPIWMTENFSKVSTQVYDKNETYGELEDIYRTQVRS